MQMRGVVPATWADRPTRETADHSMPYTVAVALIYGGVEEHHFDERHLHDPAILALAQRVKVAVSAAADERMPEAMRCYFTLVTKAGATHATMVDYHKGHYRNPMSDAEIEAKFRGLAAQVLSNWQADRLLEKLWQLEKLADAGECVRLTVAN